MQQKNVWGAAIGALNLSTLIALVFTIGRKIVSLFGDGQAASDMVVLVKDWDVNWTAIYLYLFIFSGLILLGMYLPYIQRFSQRHTALSGSTWDYSIKNAANFIAFDTYYSDTLNDENRYDLASNALKEAVIAKKILAVGRKEGAASLTLIKPREWKRLRLKCGREDVPYDDDNYEIMFDFLHLVNPGNNSVVYEGIMFNRNAIESEWRSRRSRI